MAIPSLSGQTILVTGGAGFIGGKIATHLEDQNEVRVLDDLSVGVRGQVPDGAKFIHGDILDQSALARAMDGVDIVFHEAANASVEESIQDPASVHETNVEGTLQVLEQARTEDSQVVLASSAAIYGHPNTLPIEETAAKSPASPYGLDKLTIDHYAQLYHELYGLKTSALRYFNVYGPGQQGRDYSGVIDVFIDQAQRGAPITVHGDGTQTRDFIHVSDVVRANLLVAKSVTTGEAYNIGTGRSVTIRELAETIREVTKSDSEIIFVEERKGDVTESRASVKKARRELEFAPTIGLREGIRTVCRARGIIE